MRASDDSRREWRETTAFLRAVVRFAGTDPASLGAPTEALPRLFGGIFIGPVRLREAFVAWGLTRLPQGGPTQPTSAAALRALRRDLAADLTALAGATGQWHQPLPPPEGGGARRGRRPFVATLKTVTGKTVHLDCTGSKVVLPESVRARITARLPRHELGGTGDLEPVFGRAGVRGVLYYALAVALSRDVLLRCGRCRQCGALVVYDKQPPAPLGQCFCVGVGRDCKTAFHNARKSPERKRGAQQRWRARGRKKRARAARDRATVGALGSFLAAARKRPTEAAVMEKVRRLGPGGIRGWQIVKAWEQRWRGGESLESLWASLDVTTKAIIGEGQ